MENVGDLPLIHKTELNNDDGQDDVFSAPPDPFNPPPTPSQDDRFNIQRLALLGERKRMRTESLCSNKSTAIARDLQKIRRLGEDTKPVGRQIPNRAAILKKERSMRTMKDMIYYNPRTNPMPKPKTEEEVKIKTEIKEEQRRSPVSQNTWYEPPETRGPMVPQLKLGPNGEMILDEQSLVIESMADREAKKVLESTDIVYDDGNSGKYGYFKRQKRTRDWPADETIRFYRCLHTVGTDFSLMLQLFPNRTRRDLKIKFKKEEKNNGHLIDKALLYPKEFDIDALQREFDQEDAEKEREEAENPLPMSKKTMSKKKRDEVRQLKKTLPGKDVSKTARNLTQGNAVYEVVDSFIRPKRRRATRNESSQETENESESEEPAKEAPKKDPFPEKEVLLSKKDVLTSKNEVPVSTKEVLSSEKEDILSEKEVLLTEKDVLVPEKEVLLPEVGVFASHKEILSPEKDSRPSQKEFLLPDERPLRLGGKDDKDLYLPSDESVHESDIDVRVFDQVESQDEEVEADSSDDIDLDRLVVCAAQDSNGQVTYQVHLSDPVTGELSKDPLDLPPETIEELMQNMK